MKHYGAYLNLGYPADPWFAAHEYTVRLHCGQWLRMYVGGAGEVIVVDEPSQAEELAETFHTALLEDPQCIAWEWHELNDEHRAWKIKAAQRVIDAGWVKREPVDEGAAAQVQQ